MSVKIVSLILSMINYGECLQQLTNYPLNLLLDTFLNCCYYSSLLIYTQTLPISVTFNGVISIQYYALISGPTLAQNLLRQHGPLSSPPLLLDLFLRKSQGHPTITISPSLPSFISRLSLGSSVAISLRYTKYIYIALQQYCTNPYIKYKTIILTIFTIATISHMVLIVQLAYINILSNLYVYLYLYVFVYKLINYAMISYTILYDLIQATKNLLYIYFNSEYINMIPENQTRCPDCRQLVREDLFKSHIRKCPKFGGIALRNIRKLPNNLPTLDLKFLVAELNVCRETIQQQLFQRNKGTVSGASNGKINTSHKKSGIDEQSPAIDVSAFAQDIVTCKKCHKKFYASFDASSLFYVEECWHLFCLACIKKYIDDQFVNSMGSINCPAKDCKRAMNQYQIRQLIGEKKFQDMQNKAIRKMMNIIECAKCHSQYEFQPGNPRDAPAKDNNGKALTQADKEHYAQNRFICPKPDCKAEQCKECKSIPFHIAMSCKDFKSRADMMKCRYCDEPLTAKNKSNTTFEALVDICNAKQCQGLAAGACTKILPCGHPCPGTRGEVKCLPCLHESCSKDNAELNGQTGQDYCNVCFVQALNASPCVRSHCGHIFHQKCLKKRYQIRWLTPRIFFNFCLCPLCKKWVTVPQESKLAPFVKNNSEIFNKIQTMSLERLKFQGCDKDQKLKDPKSPYHDKPSQYAMAIYAYFECFKCKNPYFGGRKNCAQAMNDQQNAGSFKPQQLVCPNCCQIPIQNCPKHGKDFIQFKCKFCCSTAQWFCWGNTHFCQPCHKKQCNGDYVSKYPKQKLPKCQGPGKCPTGGNHNGNGQQKTLGCAICRNYKANSKDF